MNTENIAQKLLVGSRNIDRMKEEIKQVVCMVIGMSHPTLPSLCHDDTCTEYQKFTSLFCVWEVTLDHINGEMGVRCLLKSKRADGTRYDALEVAFDTRLNEGRWWFCGSYNQLVQDIHADLDFFLGNLIEKFPHIAKRWQFLIDASEVNMD